MATQPTFWDSVGTKASELFSDPNFIQMLGGIGAQMDPNGAGGILGRSAIAYSRNKAAQDLAAKQLAGRDAERKELRDMNQRLLDRLGPITPSGTPGPNSAKETKSGSLLLDVDTGDPYKLAADLGGFSPLGTPGVNSIRQTSTGSYLFDVDAPEITRRTSIADQVDDFAPGNLYQTNVQNAPLSYTPVNAQERVNEMADLMQTSLPPAMYANMKSPTAPPVQYANNPSQQRPDMNSILPQNQIAQVEPADMETMLPRRSLRRRNTW